MKIPSIHLKDFRIYEEADVLFDEPLSIVRGANHAGKSSLGQAVQLSLTSRTDGTDPRGAGSNDKIRTGGHKAIIDMAVETKQGPVTLKTTYGPNATGRKQAIMGGNNGTGVNFERFMESNTQRLSCCLDAEYFIGLKPETQKAVLAALVLPTTAEFDPAMTALAEKYLGTFQWQSSPVALIDSVYKSAYDARRDAKAALSSLYIPDTPRKPEHTSEAVQAELAKLRAGAAKETKKLKGGGSQQVGRIEGEITAHKARRETGMQALAALRHDLDHAGKGLLDGPAVTKFRKSASNRAKYDEYQGAIEEARKSMREQEQAQQIYAELRKDPYCPTCTQSITDTFIDGKIGEHRKLEEQAISIERQLLQEQKELGDISGAERKLAANEENKQKVLDLKRKTVETEERITGIDKAITDLEKALETAKANEAAPPDTSALDELTAKVQEWEAQLGPAVQYETTLANIETLTARKAQQEQTIADLEKLCAYFGKDGIKAGLIQEHIDGFTATVNEVLATWGYSAKLSIEPYAFLVTGPVGELPLKELSVSEQLAFGVALQCAIAVHAKIRMVLIDRADTFVNAERGKLFTCVKSLLDSGALDQAIILVSDERTTAPKQDGVAFYQITDGKVVRLP